MRPLHSALLAAAVAAGVPSYAVAQQVQREDPGALERRFREEPAPQSRAPGPAISIPGSETVAPEGAGKLRFKLQRVAVEGSTVYPPGTLEGLAADLLGKEISLQQAIDLVDRVTARYRSDGYVLSRAILPPQEVEATLRIRIVEGYVDSIKVEGGVTDRFGLIGGGGAARRVLKQKPLHYADLERLVLLANDLAGVEVRSVLSQSKGAPAGASTLTLVANNDRFSAFAGADNFGTELVGPVETTAGGSVSNLSGLFEQVNGRVILADPTGEPAELRYARGGMELPLGGNGLKLFAGGSYSEAEPGKALADTLGLRSESMSLDLRLAYPIIRSRRENLFIDGGFRYFDTRSKIFNQIVELSEDRLRSFSVTAAYDIADSFGGTSLAQGTFEQAVRIFNPTVRGMSRGDAENDYSVFRMYLARYQNLGVFGADPRFTLFTAIEGQYTPDHLPSAAEFTVGGSRFGRGYHPSEIAGEDGLSGKIELQFSDRLSWIRNSRFQAFAFLDAGWTQDDSFRVKNETLSSIGAGVRFDFNNVVSAEVYGAKPLSRDMDDNPVTKENGRAGRLLFSVTTRY